MNRLVHPATLFVMALAATEQEVAFKDMDPLQKQGIWEYMHADGDGSWGRFPNPESALEEVGDVIFRVGSFPNDDTMKHALASCFDEAEGSPSPVDYFNTRFVCPEERTDVEMPPVILSSEDDAAWSGLMDHGYGWFTSYWCWQPSTRYITFRKDWNPADPTGRGGQ